MFGCSPVAAHWLRPKLLVRDSVFVLYLRSDEVGELRSMAKPIGQSRGAAAFGELVMVRVLGPVDLVGSSGAVVPETRIGRKLLGALAISANHMVSSDQLAEILWGETRPPSWTNTLQTYVYRLRRLLDPDRIVSEDHSYGLMVSPHELDALIFERWAGDAADLRSDPPACVELSRKALGLWRGVPFGEFADQDPFRLEAIRLDEIRLFVMEIELDAELAMGRSDMAIGTLEALVDEHPYRERLWFLLVRALSACGRRVEAIRAVGRLREILAEAGLEPTVDLLQLEDEILTERPEVRPHLIRRSPTRLDRET